MKESLKQFAGEYMEDGTRISKFKKYRKRLSLYTISGIMLFVLSFFNGFKNLFQSFPYPDIAPFIPAAVVFALGIVVLLGKRDLDVGTEDVTYFEIASAIRAMENNDVDATLDHIYQLKREVKRTDNGLFSEKTVDRIDSYYNRLDNSQNPEGILNDTFEEFFEHIIGEISEENEIDNILQDISAVNKDEFTGSVLLDSIRRIDLDMWGVLALISGVGSFFIFNIVGKDTGYYVGIISLTVIQVLSERQD